MPKSKKSEALPAKDAASAIFSSKEYASTLSDLKKQIRECQLRAAVAANKELIRLYWTIGKTIAEKQEQSGWGSKFVEKIAKDLQNEFPGIEGFSRTNVFRMRAFYLAYSDCLTAVGQFREDRLEPFLNIPWGHNFILLDKLKSFEERLWYAQRALEHGWSRDVMTMWIKSELHKREGKAITNFKATLPPPQSDLATQSLKDPYLFDFIGLRDDHNEKEIEQGLVDHVRRFLMELGSGFAFVGQQYPLEVSGKNYFIDLLLYNFKLRRFFVVEIKARAFDPRDTGQTNFYLSAVDDLLKHPEDQPTIGLILCKTKDNITAEYALRNLNSPIGVAGYETRLTESLPKELKGSLPSIKEIEEELDKEVSND
jgi:predicted nuclease of restriction endonuclease-like (RecB) superfamily